MFANIDQKMPISPFHEGEKEAQTRVGLSDQMERFGSKVIRPFLPDQHREFFNQLPFLFVGHVDPTGWPWATLVTGKPGFMTSPERTILNIDAMPAATDHLRTSLYNGKKLGFLGIELHSRRRNRLNASVSSVREDSFQVTVDQSFGNCPQYIQTRDFDFIRDPKEDASNATSVSFTELDKDAVQLIEQADTFFVSSYVDLDEKASSGVDMSHRGGRPGFVKVEGNTLTIPDYTGNNHFNTIGNFLLNPKAGLLFLNFETGDMLQLTGTVDVLWDGPEVEYFQGAERAWTFTLDHGVWLKDALPIRWRFGEMSLNSLITGNWEDTKAAMKAEELRSEWRDYRVVDIADESSVIRSFYLESTDDAGLLTFDAGQYLTVQANPSSEDKACIRTYTLSSAPLDKTYRISVKKEGRVSSYLHDQVKVGDVLKARAPKGNFTLDAQDNRPAVLLTAGVGITPMMSMIRHALQEGFRKRSLRPITLIYSAKNSIERAFDKEIRGLVSQTGSIFQYVSLLGQVDDTDELDVNYNGVGYITHELLQDVLPSGDCDYYLCGSSKFMQANYDLLRQMGVKDKRIFAESFGPASLHRQPDEGEAEVLATAATEALVTFSKSGVEQIWREEEGPLLDFAENHGLTPEFGCRNGACGSCSVPIKSGAVTYEVTPAAGIEEGQALLCCALPVDTEDPLILEI